MGSVAKLFWTNLPNYSLESCLCSVPMAMSMATLLDQSYEDGDGVVAQQPPTKRCKRADSPSYMKLSPKIT